MHPEADPAGGFEAKILLFAIQDTIERVVRRREEVEQAFRQPRCVSQGWEIQDQEGRVHLGITRGLSGNDQDQRKKLVDVILPDFAPARRIHPRQEPPEAVRNLARIDVTLELVLDLEESPDQVPGRGVIPAQRQIGIEAGLAVQQEGPFEGQTRSSEPGDEEDHEDERGQEHDSQHRQTAEQGFPGTRQVPDPLPAHPNIRRSESQDAARFVASLSWAVLWSALGEPSFPALFSVWCAPAHRLWRRLTPSRH